MKLLLIDDDARLTAMLSEYLTAAGFEVASAGSLKAGRQLLAEGNHDLLVLDLMLPDGDGLDFCRELRAHPQTRRLPVLMLSARGESMDRILGLELGADDYLAKPFEPGSCKPGSRPCCADPNRLLPKMMCCASAGWKSIRQQGWPGLTGRPAT